MADERRYTFSWELLGDIGLGRPNLGNTTRVEMYRLMMFTLRDIIEGEYGTEAADRLFYAAGKKAGAAFFDHFLAGVQDQNEFVRRLQSSLREMGVGVLRIESIADGAKKLTLTMDEDLDCSGLPELDFETCVYDEGFIAGILEHFSGDIYNVKEIDCWCTGGRTCRFAANKAESAE